MTRLLIIIPLLFLCTAVYSQSPVQVFSPNAANLGQYGQIPVNYFNGLPEISIPLTSFKAKGYELPISLTYHASGNHPDSHPGWIGLGWSLNAGGMINRIVNGYKDEKSEKEFQYLSNVSYGDSQFAYYYQAEQLQNSNWSDETFLSEISKTSAVTRPLGTEPDEFQISIDDIQASFYIVGPNKVKIKSKTNANFKVKIELDTSNSTYVLYKNSKGSKNLEANLFTYISEIIIIKDNGTKYYFGGDRNAIEFSFVQYPNYALGNTVNTNEWKAVGTANSWLLRKIEFSNGETVELAYEKSGTPVVMSDSHYGEAYVLDGNSGYGSLFDTKQQSIKYGNISFTFIQPSYLRSIRSVLTKNEILFNKSKSQELEYDITKPIFDFKVGDFYYYDSMNAGEFSYANIMAQNYYMKLDEIVEKNKRIRLRYSADIQTRLRLLSVSLLDNNGYQVSGYDLEYSTLKLPSYNSKKMDKWGYYNNKYYGNTSYENLATYRTPDEYYMQAEILTGITYPTGGQSEFIYEAHRYSRVAQQFDFAIKPNSGIAGGLRIKEIKTIDNGKTTTREFEYTDSLGYSSGILSGNHIYYASGRQHINFHYSRWWGLVYENIKVDYKATYYVMQESNINQLSTTSGNHVTYSRVVEKLSDGSKVIYTYSNHDQFMDETPIKMLDNINKEVLANSFISKELERGLLLKIEYIDSAGKTIKTEINRYNSSPARYNDFVKSINQMQLVSGAIKRISALKLYTFYPYLESKTTIIRDSSNGDSLTTVTNYEYNSDKLPSKISTVNSKNDVELDIMRYTGDMRSGIYTQMQANNMVNYPVEKTSVRDDCVVRSELSTYKKNDSNYDYVPEKVYKARFTVPLSYGQFVHFDGLSKDSHYGLPEVEYTRYDRNSNIEEFVTKDIHTTTCMWGYNNEYPIGIFENACNNYKVTSRYEDYRKNDNVSLNRTSLSQNVKAYNFYTSKSGTVEIVLAGALGDNWYVSGNLDGRSFSLVTMRSSDNVGLPWTNYQQAYKGSVTFDVSAGSHTLRISSTDLYKGKGVTGYNGDLRYTYWSKRNIAPDISGSNDVFYETFENSYSDNVVPFGFNSTKSYAGPYTVTLPSNPLKSYKIDYQVFKNGRWNYRSNDFINGVYTVNEGDSPIDEIRVYPQEATVSTFTYFPFLGLRSKTDERGISESYDYGTLGRLMAVRDNNSSIVRVYDYKYYDQVSGSIPESFYNIELKRTFIKDDCDSLHGQIGQPIEYIVPRGKHTSSVSQEDANRKAYDDLLNNGQRYANENGECSDNIVVYVYNIYSDVITLEYTWGVQGSITEDYYQIPPGERIGDTDNILEDYRPIILYIPRRNYRNVRAYFEGDYSGYVDLSIRSTPYTFDVFYTTGYYSDYQDFYVIGEPTFPVNRKK